MHLTPITVTTLDADHGDDVSFSRALLRAIGYVKDKSGFIKVMSTEVPSRSTELAGRSEVDNKIKIHRRRRRRLR